jgi:hypothetical protein
MGKMTTVSKVEGKHSENPKGTGSYTPTLVTMALLFEDSSTLLRRPVGLSISHQ